ncbi:MAG TPA: diaminopimelate epimerase, partial [Flexistipes sinusarabici]|nr:diaminopimelate epimerase [Flexistipes sinusarabici]
MISEFYKMSGGGNDFIVIDNTDNSIPESKASGLAEKLCKRQLSVGADGLILICSSKEDDFKWLFYNSDGSVAEMCGNGARCAARFAYINGIAGRSMTFETLAGKIKAEIIDDNSVKVLMTPPLDANFNYSIEIDNKWLEVSSVNTGVPHVIIKSENIADEPLIETGRKIRFHDKYSPAGTNVNFY